MGHLAPSRRCPACGQRAAAADPGCAEHGPIAVPEGELERAQRDATELPAFEGLRTSGVLGRGGFGVVYAVERIEDGARFAAKRARAGVAGAARSVVREIRALREIGPPYVPAVHGTGMLDGVPYVVMDRIEAPTLAARLAARPGPMPLQVFSAIATAVVSVVAAVHARPHVHHDLKPENILVDDFLGVTLIDLGVGSPSDEEGPGVAVGTTEYMAPEQHDPRAALDARADVYALGVVLYEMLAGRPPFWGPAAAVRESHRTRRPAPPSTLASIPTALEEVVLRCLSKRPEDRFESAKELLHALLHALQIAGEPPSSAAPWSSQTPASMRIEARRRVGLVFFEAALDPVALHRRLLLLGGELAHAAGRRSVALFSHDVGDNPARRALRAAHTLVHEGLAARALVDLAPVHVQTRRDGSRRYVGANLLRGDRFATDGDPGGVLLTPAAAAVLTAAGGEPAAGAAWIRADTRGEVQDPGPTMVSGDPLVGRRVLLEALLRSARAVVDGEAPTVVTVLGDLGTGKSRVARELRERLGALHPGATLLTVAVSEPDAGGVGGTIGELLRQALALPNAAPPDAGEALLRERLGAPWGAARWPAVALSLGWLPADAPALRALDAAPGALRSALVVTAGEALRGLAAAGEACLVVIDDVHLADDATLSALDYAALAEAGARLWICGLGRPTLAQARPGWGERAGRREAHEIGPLDAESAAALCRQLLLPVVEVPEAAIQRLVTRAGAVPLLLVELVRGLKRDGLVRAGAQDGAGSLVTDAIERAADLPVLEWMAQRELDALAPAAAAHARLVALLGDEVTIAEVASVLRTLERAGRAAELTLDPRAGTERLLAAGLLVPRAGGRAAFRHPLLREAIARGATASHRRHVHLAAFEHHRAAGGARLDRLAAHAAAAGLRDEAAAAYAALAEQARACHAYLDAEIAYGHVIELASAPPLLARRGRGLMRYRIGRYEDALADLAAAREQAALAGDTAAEIEILLDEATALDWTGEYRTSSARVAQARALVEAPAPPAVEARLLLGSGRWLYRSERWGEAAVVLERAAELAAGLGDEGYETWVITLLMLGYALQGLGRLDGAARALDDAIRRCEEHADLLHLGSALSNRALLRALLGDRQGAVADFTRVIALGRELGQGTLELVGEFNLGEYLYLMDDLAAAEPHTRAAAAAAVRQTGGSRPTVVALLEARLRLYRGDEEGAAAIAAEIRRRQAEAREKGAADQAMAPSEDVLCAMIELATAASDDAAWDHLEARSAVGSIGQEHVEVLEARALAALRRGRLGDAARQLEKAQRAAARIPNVMGERLARRLAGLARSTPPPGAPG